MSTLLEVEDLHVDFTTEERVIRAVRGVSFTVAPGQTVALVGESGSGKSVTALSVLRLLPYPPASHPKGRVLFKGTDLLNAPDDALRAVRGNGVSMIFQEPMSSLNPLHTVERQVSEALIVHRGMNRTEARARTIELLAEVGIQNPESRLADFPHQLSGGQRQRVVVARALAPNPEIIVADEPISMLDVSIRAEILQLLDELVKGSGISMLYITHDLLSARLLADKILVLHHGRVVEHGDASEVITNPQHEYTQELLNAIPNPFAMEAAAAD